MREQHAENGKLRWRIMARVEAGKCDCTGAKFTVDIVKIENVRRVEAAVMVEAVVRVEKLQKDVTLNGTGAKH